MPSPAVAMLVMGVPSLILGLMDLMRFGETFEEIMHRMPLPRLIFARGVITLGLLLVVSALGRLGPLFR